MHSNVAPNRGKITDWWFGNQKTRPPKHKGRGKVASNLYCKDMTTGYFFKGSKGSISKKIKCTPSTVQKACDDVKYINGRYKIWVIGNDEPIIIEATRGGYYYCFDGIKWIEGQRNVIDKLSGARMHNHMIKGLSLLNRRYAVGHSKEEAIERYEKLKHLQRKVVNGFAMVEISKDGEKYELTIPEAAKILQVADSSVRTSASQERVCVGWFVRYVGLYE